MARIPQDNGRAALPAHVGRKPMRSLATYCSKAAPDAKSLALADAAQRNPTSDVDPKQLRAWYANLAHEALMRSPRALEHLGHLGLRFAELVLRFKIGFVDGSLADRLGALPPKRAADMRAKLEALGLLRGDEEVLGNCILIPLHDQAGDVVGLYAWHIAPTPGSPSHCLLGDPGGIFNAEAVQGSKTWILCDSLIDCLTFIANDYPAATVALGSTHVLSELVPAMRRAEVEHVFCAHDASAAGDGAAENLAEACAGAGIRGAWRVALPRGMTANDLASTDTASKVLGYALRDATGMLDASPTQKPVMVSPLIEDLALLRDAVSKAMEALRRGGLAEPTTHHPPAAHRKPPIARAPRRRATSLAASAELAEPQRGIQGLDEADDKGRTRAVFEDLLGEQMSRQDSLRLRQAISVVHLVGESHVELEHQEELLLGNCPLHAADEAQRSTLVVDPAANTWSCPTCAVTAGSVVDWLMRRDNINARAAMKAIRLRLGELPRPSSTSPSPDAIRPATGPVSPLAASLAETWLRERGMNEASLLDDLAQHYHDSLKAFADPLRHLNWRGDIGKEIVDHFQLGYATGALADLLERTPEHAVLQANLRELGILRPDGLELFAGSLVVPVHDAVGRVVQLCGGAYQLYSGRLTSERWLARPHGLFHRPAYELGEEIILAPTVLDALRFWRAGYTHVSTWAPLLGISADQLELMRSFAIRRAILVHELDEMSVRAIEEASATLATAGIDTYRVALGRRFKATSKAWGQMLKDATPMLGASPRPNLPALDPAWTRSASHQRSHRR